MGLDSLQGFLRRYTRVAVDTNIFIYEIEAHPRYLPFTRDLFRWLEDPRHAAITSTLTMTEVLTGPYLSRDAARAKVYFALLSNYPHLEWIAPDLDIADQAARFRAQHRLRTPDAIQAATAVRTRVNGFITNDPAFRRVKELEILLLDDLA